MFRIKLLIFFINFFSRNSRMTILGIFNWEFINTFIERENPENEWFEYDSWVFISCLRDAGLQKDQGDDVLDALGLNFLSLKLSRRNSAAVQTSDCTK